MFGGWTDGHCGLPTEDFVPVTQNLIEIPPEPIATALDLKPQDGAVIADDLDGRHCVFLAGLYRAEWEIAKNLNARAVGKPPWPSIDAGQAIPWLERRAKLALAESQIAAIRVGLASKVLVITGGLVSATPPLVNFLLKFLLAKGVTIALCAPTGRAVKRLSESTVLEAKTIYRLLETDPRAGSFRRNEVEPLDCDLLVIDETQWSMCR
jgi:exodeoxyribonuclease V alpha subunit